MTENEVRQEQAKLHAFFDMAMGSYANPIVYALATHWIHQDNETTQPAAELLTECVRLLVEENKRLQDMCTRLLSESAVSSFVIKGKPGG